MSEIEYVFVTPLTIEITKPENTLLTNLLSEMFRRLQKDL